VIRAVLFDLDGTLVDSLADIASALSLALADHGLERPAIETVRTWTAAERATSSPTRSTPRGSSPT
jgi:phosphoglycolate phosphatase-like HAD superfamily hydrolase